MTEPWGDRQGEFSSPRPESGQPPWSGQQPSANEPYAAEPNATQPYPAQPNQAQPYGTQPHAAQTYGTQPNAAQTYGTQPYSGQPYSGQIAPAAGYSGQPYPAQASSIQPYSGQPYAPVPVAGGTLVSAGARFGAFLLDGLLCLVTLGIGYLIWALITWSDGQTPAKRLLGHVVVDAQTGVPFDWGRMVLRQFVIQGLLGGLLSSLSLGIYFWVDALMVFGERQRTLHDRMANSVVRYV